MPHETYSGRATTQTEGMLDVDDCHSLHYAMSGLREGPCVLVLHGGPGTEMQAGHFDAFDPRLWRRVSFDQRGTGRSTPLGELAGNTTQDLVADIERLRRHLGIDTWLVAGGSWGSALALAYAVRHPERVRGMLLRGVFTCTDRELRWLLYGVRAVFPEAWRQFATHLDPAERDDLLAAYHRRVHSTEPDIHLPAALEWCRYERSLSRLLPGPDDARAPLDAGRLLVLARIQTHYFTHRFFLGETDLLDDVRRIRHVPGVIVQGRYDMVCPAAAAERLHRVWPASRLEIVANAGHAADEPGIRRALVRAAATLHTLISHPLAIAGAAP